MKTPLGCVSKKRSKHALINCIAATLEKNYFVSISLECCRSRTEISTDILTTVRKMQR